MDNNESNGAFRVINGNLMCAKCGMEILNHNMNYCPNCGNKFNKQVVNNNIEEMSIQNLNNDITKETNKRDNSAFFVLFAINFFCGIPMVVVVFFVGMLGAAFGDTFSSYVLLLGCCGYILASVVGLFVFGGNWDLKRSFLVIFISFLIGCIIPIVFHMF